MTPRISKCGRAKGAARNTERQPPVYQKPEGVLLMSDEVAVPEADVLETIDWDTVQWETVIAEAGIPLEFKTVGDKFIGIYTGMRTARITDNKGNTEEFTVLTFQGPGGVAYQTNAGWKLESGFKDSEIIRGDIVCVTYVKDVDTGQPSPMKDFKVQRAIRPQS